MDNKLDTENKLSDLKPGDLIKIKNEDGFQRYAWQEKDQKYSDKHIDENEVVMFLSFSESIRFDLIYCLYDNSIWEMALNPEDEIL